MEQFDFIGGDDFRGSLESDYSELTSSMTAGNWKAVHVLAGSIVEAILIDYLISIGYQNRSPDTIQKMSLSDAIKAARDLGILSQKSADLSSVIRDYRNLIHPGRVARLGEKADKNSATVAVALVGIIIGDVSENKQKVYGLTAQQIATKLVNDATAVTILGHLLKITSPMELKHLIVEVLPNTLSATQFFPAREALKKCFHMAFQMASEEAKTMAMHRLVKIIKEEGDKLVLAQEAAFFRGRYLVYLSTDDAALVKQHILSRLQTDAHLTVNEVLQMIDGLGPHLIRDDAFGFVSGVVKQMEWDMLGEFDEQYGLISSEYQAVPGHEVRDEISNGLEIWIRHLDQHQMQQLAAKVTKLQLQINIDSIPF